MNSLDYAIFYDCVLQLMLRENSYYLEQSNKYLLEKLSLGFNKL